MGTVALVLMSVIAGWALMRYVNREQFAHFNLAGSLPPVQRAILEKHFRFYHFLPLKSRRIFEHRVAKFIRLKEFIPRQMDEITLEMKVLIAASAIQLTFGFPKIFLSYFKYIIVFPDQFFSNANQRYHKGEVNPGAKAIVLSWRHFVQGYADSEGVNLGLHEMAHALQLENIVMNYEYDFLDAEAIRNWQELASTEIARMREGQESLFRAYGSTNHLEFFAVAVENFFERPEEFAAYSYPMYKAMSDLIRQDPLLLYKKLQ